MRRAARGLVLLGAAVLASAPFAGAATALLLPAWRRLEAATGLEAVGHSGPASWCYALTWASATTALGVVFVRLRRPPPRRS